MACSISITAPGGFLHNQCSRCSLPGDCSPSPFIACVSRAPAAIPCYTGCPPPPAPPAPSAPPAPIASMTYASPANSWVIAAAVVGDAAALFLSATGGAPASSPFLSAGTGSVAASGNGVWQLPRKTECGASPTGLRWLLLANQGLEWQRRVPLQMLGALAAEGRGPLARRLQPVRYVFAYCKKIGKITNRVI